MRGKQERIINKIPLNLKKKKSKHCLNVQTQSIFSFFRRRPCVVVYSDILYIPTYIKDTMNMNFSELLNLYV